MIGKRWDIVREGRLKQRSDSVGTLWIGSDVSLWTRMDV